MYEVSQEVAVASFFLVFEGSRACSMGLVTISFSWGMTGAVAMVLAVGQVVILGSDDVRVYSLSCSFPTLS